MRNRTCRRGWWFLVCIWVAVGPAMMVVAADGEDPAIDKYYIANALYNKKMFDLAVEEYRAFLARYPAHPKATNAKFGLALSLYELKDYQAAMPIFAELAGDRDSPQLEQVHNLWGQCLLIAGQPAEAESAFRWSVNRGKEKLFIELPGVGRSTDEAPKLPVGSVQDMEPLERGMVGLIESLHQQAKWSEVISFSRELAQLAPRGQYTMRARFLAALALYETKQYSGAISALEELIGQEVNFPFAEHAYFLLAECRRELGEDDAAMRDHQVVARKFKGPLAPNAMFRVGYILFMQKKYQEAAIQFSDLQTLYENHALAPEAGIYLGRCHVELKNYPKAQAVFGGLTNHPAVTAKANLWLSENFLRQQDYAGAANVLKEAVRTLAQDPLFPNLLYNYGCALMGLKSPGDAARIFDRVTSDFKEFSLTPDALRMKAFCLNQSREYQLSVEACDQFVRQYGQDGFALDVAFLRAENWFFLNELDQAIEAYRKFIPWRGRSKFTDEAIFRIAQCLCRQEKWREAADEMKPLLEAEMEGEFFIQLHYLAGLSAFHLEQWPAAAAGFNRFVTLHPADEHADASLLMAAMAHGHLGEYDAALPLLQRLVEQYPESSHFDQALCETGRLLYQRQDYVRAQAVLARVAADFPESKFIAQALYYQGWIAQAQKQFDEAIRLFTEVADQHGQDPLATDALFQEAVIHIDRGNFARAQTRLKQFLARQPGDAAKRTEAAFYLALAATRQGQDATAEQLQEFIREHPASPWAARARYEAAWQARNAGQTSLARDHYLALLAAFPLGELAERATFELAELEYEAGNYDAAIALLDKLQARGLEEPLRHRVFYRMAWCMLGREEPRKALPLFEQVITDAPRDSALVPVAAYQAGELRMGLKEYANAGRHFLLAANHDRSSEVRPQALLRIGENQALLELWADAEQTFDTFLGEFPDHPMIRRARLWRGWSRENQRRYGPAIEDYRGVLRSGERDELAARSQFQIGECHFAAGELDEALRELIKVELLYSFPEWTTKAIFETGQVMDKKGRREEAVEQYHKIIKQFPQSPEARLSRELLRQRNIFIDN